MSFNLINTRSVNVSMTVFAAVMFVLVSATAQAATIQVINLDGPGEGFNDTTPYTPGGGNPATTLGAARLNAFQHGADIVGAMLTSNVVIKVQAAMNPMGGSAGSATLGSAGPTTVHRGFTGAPVASAWYVQAVANKLTGSDVSAANNDINAQFNSDVDGAVVLGATTWYYGYDATPPGNDIDFVSVILHEIIHGLGFLSLVDLATGAKFNAGDDAYMLNLEHHGVGQYPALTDVGRVNASVSGNSLHLIGPQVLAAVPAHAGAFAPNPAQPGSSVSHFNEVTLPNELMSPYYSGPMHDIGLAAQMLGDVGWGSVGASSVPGDHNGDSKRDILFHNTNTAQNYLLLMNGRSVLSAGYVRKMAAAWQIVGSGDYNGDGKSDILFHNTNTAQNFMMLMNGRTVLSAGFVRKMAAPWQIVGSGDYNGDGKSDILLHHSGTAQNYMMLMNGRTVLSKGYVRKLAAAWQIVGSGDYNGDGKSDILFHNTNTAQNYMMLMNGRTVLSNGYVRKMAASWQIAGSGDYDGDGKDDILLHNTNTSQNYMLRMSGRTVLSAGYVRKMAASWQVVNAD